MADDPNDELEEEQADEVPVEEEPEDIGPPPEEEGPPPYQSRQSYEQDQARGCGPSGSAKPCSYRPKKKKKRSYIWGPPKPLFREPSYSPCPHIYFKNLKENVTRDGLSRDDWMDILSTPNPTPWVKKGSNGEKLVRYRRKKCTKRTKQLAIPRIALVRANWEDYKGILSEDMLERLRQILADDFHMTPEEIKEFIKRGKQAVKPKRKKRKKKRKPSLPVELTDEEWMRNMLTEVAGRATEISEYQHPSAPSGRLEMMINTILERLAALAGEEPPPRNATGLIARLMIVIAEKLACWLESVVCEADKESDERPCSARGIDFLSMLFCSPNCETVRQIKAARPCANAAPKRHHKRKHSKSKSPKPVTCCGMKIKEIVEEEPEEPPPPAVLLYPECKCACMCVQTGRRKRGKKGKKKGKKGKKKGGRHEEEEEEEEAVHEPDGHTGGKGGGAEDGEGQGGTTDDDDSGGDGGEKGPGDGDGDGGGGGNADADADAVGDADADADAEGNADADAEGDGGGGEQKGGGSGTIGSNKSSKDSPSKPASSKSSANASATKSSANAAGASKTSADKSKSNTNAAASKSSANAGSASGSKSGTNAAGSKSSANAGGASKSSTNAAGSKSSGNAGGASKSSTNAAGSKSSANAGGASKSSTNAAGSKSSANAGGASKSSTNAAAEKSKSSADVDKSKTSVKGSESKASTKSKADEDETAYKVTSGEDGVLTVEPQSSSTPDEDIEGDLEAKISELGANVAEEAIEEGAANVAEGDLPPLTFGSIIDHLAEIIEDAPEDAEKSERREKLAHTLEDKFKEIVENDKKPHSPDGLNEVVADVADKVAGWMDGVIRDAETRRASGGIPGEVASMEVREWAEWIVGVMGIADDWAGWITKTVAGAEEKARIKKGEARTPSGEVKKLTKAEWAEWKQLVRQRATEFQDRKQSIKNAALKWEQRTKGKKVIPSKSPTTSSNDLGAEEEQKVTDIDSTSEKRATPDSQAEEEDEV